MIALDNVPSGVLQARLARYGKAASARAALLLLTAGDHLVPAAAWTADDPASMQARLMSENLLAGVDLSALRVPLSSLSLSTVLEGQAMEDPSALLKAAGLDPSLASLPAEVAGINAYAAIPIGPRASQGLVVLALESMPQVPELRRAARSLLEPSPDDSPTRVAANLGATFMTDLVRLYRVDAGGLATVVAAWQSGGTILPEAGESVSIAGTPLEAVLESKDAALVETASRGDWLSALSVTQGIQITLFSPLFKEGQPRAIVELATRRSDLPLAAINERLPGFSEELVALLDQAPAAELEPYELVRSFVTKPVFKEDEGIDRLCLEVLRADKQSVQFVVGGPVQGDLEIAPLAGSATGDVMSGQPAAISTEQVNGWFNQALFAQGFRSVLRVPLHYRDELLGVLSLASRRPDAFATSPGGVGTLAEQLSLLVAAERSRLDLVFDGRQGELLAGLSKALASEPAGAFAQAAALLAAEVGADAVWLQGPAATRAWPASEGALMARSPAQPRCRADLSQRAEDEVERELAGRGYRSLVVIPEGETALICAARAGYAFDAQTVTFLSPAAKLLSAAVKRESVLGAGGGMLSRAPEEQPAMVIEAASGEVLEINERARALLSMNRGDNLWAIASQHGAAAARSQLTASRTAAQTVEVSLVADGRRMVLEARADAVGDGMWQLVLRDVTAERAKQRLLRAIQEVSSAAQSAGSAAQLRETVERVFGQHGLAASFKPGVPAAGDGAALALDDHTLVVEHEAGEDGVDALERLRSSLTAILDRIAEEERLRVSNRQLADAVAARTAELEGLYAYSRDLGETEGEQEALDVAVTHLAGALSGQAGSVVCLEGNHLGAGSDDLQWLGEDLLRELQPDQHESCRALLRRPVGTAATKAMRAFVPTTRGSGLLLVDQGSEQPGADQLKLLVTHATQLGAALDRMGVRREAEESRLRSIADVVDEGIALVDDDGTIRPENAAATRLLDVLRQPDGTYNGQLESQIEGARESDQPIEQELSAAGRTILAAARSIPGSGGRVALTLRDVTEQRLTQDRLAQSERLAALGQLVSGVAHELNNPLTGILGFAQLLQDQPLEDDTRRGVETIQSEAERAGKIIQDLLSFARRREPVREPLDINELISRVLNIRSYDLQGDGIDVELSLAAELPAVVGDGDQLQQVFFNVLTNAIQAVREVQRKKRIMVETRAEVGQVVVRFTDNGPGVGGEALPHVFEPFFTTKQAGEGTGLGLSISYGIIQEHDGSIELRNEARGGATVEIRLPAASAATEPSAVESTTGPVARSGARILVADDEASIREVLSQMLAADGHEVVAVADGAEALHCLSHQDFDIVITDLKMPEISGQELYNEIRASTPELAPRVIFITGDTVNEESRVFMASVDNPTLEKPFRLERLRELIRQALA